MHVEQRGKDLIVIPEGLDAVQVHDWVSRWEQKHTKIVALQRRILGSTEEIVYAANIALERLSSLVDYRGVQTMFGSNPPAFMDVEFAPGMKKSCFYGKVGIPELQGGILAIGPHGGGCVLAFEGMAKFQHIAQAWFDEVEATLLRESIYRGRAVMLDWDKELEKTKYSFLSLPETVCPIFDPETENETQVFLRLIRHTERARERGISLRRGVLLAGPYGTGKTLLAHHTAKLALANGWTFFLASNALQLAKFYEVAQRLQPSVLFLEDVDRAAEEKGGMDVLQNTIDGILSKENEVILVMTTNHPEKLPAAMRRPGRLDSFIQIGYPSAETACKIVEFYATDLMSEPIDYSALGPLIADQPPASLREVVERAKIFALENHNTQLTSGNLVSAAQTLQDHFKYSKKQAKEKVTSIA